MTRRKGVKDAPAPRPNKRPRLTGPDHESISTTTSSSKLSSKLSDVKTLSKGEDDALTAEFLNVMNPRNKKGPAWADGTLAKTTAMPAARGNSPEAQPTPQAVEEQNPSARDEMSDLEWMKSRMTDIREDKGFEQSDNEDDQKPVEVVDATKVDSSILFCLLILIYIRHSQPVEVTLDPSNSQEITRQTILSTARLFVRNLTFSCTTEELQELFGRFGELDQVSYKHFDFFYPVRHACEYHGDI